jgi:hypothetical protein
LPSGFASNAGGKGAGVPSSFDGWSGAAGGGPKGGFVGPGGGGTGVIGDGGESGVLVFPLPGSKKCKIGRNFNPCPFFAGEGGFAVLVELQSLSGRKPNEGRSPRFSFVP